MERTAKVVPLSCDERDVDDQYQRMIIVFPKRVC